MTVRVLIVDDDEDFRVLLRHWIEDAGEDLVVVGDAPGPAQAVALAGHLNPDVVLLDERMPMTDGFAGAELILAARPDQRLILCSAVVDERTSERARDAGFADCVQKDDRPGLLSAIAGRESILARVPCRVFVCDDSFGYPVLVRTWIEETPGVQLAGVAMTADELLGKLPGSRADVVLLDVMLPGGLVSRQLVDELRRASSGVRVILASAMPDEILRTETARTGADAACSKLASRQELMSLILAGTES